MVNPTVTSERKHNNVRIQRVATRPLPSAGRTRLARLAHRGHPLLGQALVLLERRMDGQPHRFAARSMVAGQAPPEEEVRE